MQHWERVDPRLIGSGAVDFVGGEVLRLDWHSRHDGALRVLHDTPDSSLKLLCVHWCAQQQRKQERKQAN